MENNLWFPKRDEQWRRKPAGFVCRVIDARPGEGRALMKSPQGRAHWVGAATLQTRWERVGASKFAIVAADEPATPPERTFTVAEIRAAAAKVGAGQSDDYGRGALAVLEALGLTK